MEHVNNEPPNLSVNYLVILDKEDDVISGVIVSDNNKDEFLEYTIYECDDEFMREFGPFVDAKTISLKRMFANESVDDEPEDIRILRQIKGIRNIRKVKGGWEFHIS